MFSWLKDNIPEVEKVTRVINDGAINRRNIVYNTIKYNIERPLIIDADFFSIFSFQVLTGELASFERDKHSIALNESLANKIFGNEYPVGKIIRYKDEIFTIKAVIKEAPSNSSIKYDILLPIANIPDYANDTIWTNSTLQIFLQSADNISHLELQEKIHRGVMSFLKSFAFFEYIKTLQYKLNPLEEIYFSDYSSPDYVCIHGNRILNFLSLSLAVIILIIAMLNYINASMAKASGSIKEMGIKLVSGASRIDNMRFIIYESSITCFFAVLLSTQFCHYLEPIINPLLNVPLASIKLLHIIVIITGSLFIGALTGLYPALKLSSYNIVDSIKEKFKTGKKAKFFRGSLSVVQFTTSIAILISLFIIYKQLSYIHRQSGKNFDEDLVLYMPLSERTPTKNPKIYTIKESLKSLAEVEEISSSLHIPGDEHYSDLGIPLKYKGRKEIGIQVKHNMVDVLYPEVMGYKIINGRSFNPNNNSDYRSYIVNKAFIKKYNIENLSDAELNESPIIGVINDIHFNSLHIIIEPMAIRYFDIYQSNIVTRLATMNITSLSEVINKIRKTIDSIDNLAISDIHFLDQHIAALYKGEMKLSKMLFWMSLFSIIISCMGLFSMSLLMTKSRTKEIGIRKVLGASVRQIVSMLSREFMVLVLIANVIAWPVAWYVMSRWLENFAYRIDLGIGVFILAGVLALVIALATVSYQAVKAATANPVEALRYE